VSEAIRKGVWTCLGNRKKMNETFDAKFMYLSYWDTTVQAVAATSCMYVVHVSEFLPLRVASP
jgi:hypothetical protein